MASTTSGELLSLHAATVILKAQETRLSEIGIQWRLAFTQRPESLTPSYDTLVIELHQPSHGRSIDTVPVALHGVLLVLHAISSCSGFSYRDNPSFWTSALPRLPSYVPQHTRFDIPKPSRAFPRVVLACFYSQISGFQRDMFDIFFPTRMSELSESLKYTMKELRRCSSGASPEPIECVVRLQLGKTANDTRDMLAYMTTQLADIDQARERNPLQLAGVELLGRRKHSRHCGGLKASHLKPLQALCSNLPQSMTLALRFPQNPIWSYARHVTTKSPAQSSGFGSFFKQACGFQGSEFTGRLEVLDVIGAFSRSSGSDFTQCSFASFCTLLPYTTSLKEVRVKIVQSTDWLWLAYAAFHPQSRLSAWRRLALSVDFVPAVDAANWQTVDQFIEAGASLSALVDLVGLETSGNSANDDRQQERVRPATRRTATTVKRTIVYHDDKIRRLATLPRGQTVAVCDGESDGDWIIVLVPGYSFGYTSKSCLSPISEVEDLEPPTSCITSLHVCGVDRQPRNVVLADQRGILQLFGPSLKHLRVSAMNWFYEPGFSQHTPLLEVIGWCSFRPGFASEDFLALPKLRALYVVCDDPHVELCFQNLLLSCRLKLQELHLQLSISPGNVSAVESLLKQCLGRLLRLKVAAFTMFERFDGPRRSINLDDIATHSELGRSKRAFLSAVQSDAELSPLAWLDSSVIRQIFDFCGLCLESLIVSGGEGDEHGSPTPHEVEIGGHSWFSP